MPCLRRLNNIQGRSRGLQKALDLQRLFYSRGLQRALSSRSQRALERCHGLPEDFEKAFGCSEVLPKAIAGSRKFGNDAGGSQEL